MVLINAVANSMFDAFTNEKFVKKLMNENRSLFGKVANRIKEILADIKAAISMLGNSDATIRALKDDVESLEKINTMFDSLLEKAGEKYKEEHENRQKNNTAGAVKFSLNTQFSQDVQAWFDTTTHEERKISGKRFLVGTTTDVLKSIGVKDYNIYFGASKIDKIITGNDSMSLNVIKQAVGLLEDPILIMKSKTVENSIVIFGEVYTESNKPVMISLLLNPESKNGEILDYGVITSAYGRRISNLQNLINTSKIYYVNENKNRTDKWLKALGLQLPSALTKYGSIDIISNESESVKEKLSYKAEHENGQKNNAENGVKHSVKSDLFEKINRDTSEEE